MLLDALTKYEGILLVSKCPYLYAGLYLFLPIML